MYRGKGAPCLQEELARNSTETKKVFSVKPVRHKMSVCSTLIETVIRLFFCLVNSLYIPIFITRFFEKSQRVPPINNQILLESVVGLTEKLRNRTITCKTLLETYIARIEEVNPILNAVIDNRFAGALRDAELVDSILATSISPEELKQKYPLLGIPITIKGSISVAGLRNSSGMVSRTALESKDAVSVARIRKAGAIPLLTSNVPELCLNWECTNKLIGATNNPFDTTRTTGGSSGGEAALIASAASPFGIGSDIAGSLRIPAHYCGVFGHKATVGAVSVVGHYPSCKSDENWKQVFILGPMARFAADLRLLLGVIAEPHVKNQLQLDKPVDVRALRIYFIEDMQLKLADKVNRNVLNAIRRVVGHFNKICSRQCEEINIPLLRHASAISYLSLLAIDDVDNLFEGRGQGAVWELLRFFVGRSKSMLTSILYGVLRRFMYLIPKAAFGKTQKSIEKLTKQFAELLDENSVLILPTYPTEAPYHKDVFRKLFNPGYVSIFNVLGLPTTNCPVAMTREGLPVGVQIVGGQFCDRVTLAVAEELERVFGGWTPPSNVIQMI